MLSRTAGAPSLPIKSEEDLAAEAMLAERHMAAGMPPDRARRLAANQVQTYGAAGATQLASEYDAPGGRERLQQAVQEQDAAEQDQDRFQGEYNAATAMPQRGPVTTNSDVLPGDEPGTVRVWDDRTKTYVVRSAGPMGPRESAAPNPELGARWGGGPAFRSQAEHDAYYNRPTLSAEQRQQMLDAGATEEEIADAQASQYDQDARQAGRGTHGGYAPVYVNGRVIMAPRAPTPGPAGQVGAVDQQYTSGVRGVSPSNPRQPGSSDDSVAYDFAQDMLESDIGDQSPIPVGDDGMPVVPGWRQGTANAATGNAATGPRAANRDVPPSLRRPDLEERGYEAVFMDGPNGGEWVYRLKDTQRLANAGKNKEDRARRTTQRLRVQAGVVGNARYDNADDNQLRELIAAKREAEEQAKELQWRPRTMIRGGNAIGALALPGLDPAQQAAILGGPTPLDVQARNAAMGAQFAQQAITGFLANTPQPMTPEQRAMFEQKLREGNPSAAGAGDLGGRNPESAEAQAELDRLANSYDTTWGGFSYDNERALARALQQPPYNMSQAAAEEYAYRAAERQRFLWNQGGGRATPASGASASGAAAAWGGAPDQGGI